MQAPVLTFHTMAAQPGRTRKLSASRGAAPLKALLKGALSAIVTMGGRTQTAQDCLQRRSPALGPSNPPSAPTPIGHRRNATPPLQGRRMAHTRDGQAQTAQGSRRHRLISLKLGPAVNGLLAALTLSMAVLRARATRRRGQEVTRARPHRSIRSGRLPHPRRQAGVLPAVLSQRTITSQWRRSTALLQRPARLQHPVLTDITEHRPQLLAGAARRLRRTVMGTASVTVAPRHPEARAGRYPQAERHLQSRAGPQA